MRSNPRLKGQGAELIVSAAIVSGTASRSPLGVVPWSKACLATALLAAPTRQSRRRSCASTQIQAGHRLMEANGAGGKIVVRL